MPEVGLEPHSSPSKYWDVQKTYGIRASPVDVRPSPKQKVCALYTLTFRPFSYTIDTAGAPLPTGGISALCTPFAPTGVLKWAARYPWSEDLTAPLNREPWHTKTTCNHPRSLQVAATAEP